MRFRIAGELRVGWGRRDSLDETFSMRFSLVLVSVASDNSEPSSESLRSTENCLIVGPGRGEEDSWETSFRTVVLIRRRELGGGFIFFLSCSTRVGEVEDGEDREAL